MYIHPVTINLRLDLFFKFAQYDTLNYTTPLKD